MLPSRTPGATYRLQMQPAFTLDDATAIVPYLHDLGVTHLYLSPVLQATPGSTHGYDTVDPTRVNEELGGREALDRLVAAAHERGLGLVLDIVPNHMSIADRGNRWWWDVLENGPHSRYASYFDVSWNDADARVLMPVLGDHYGRVLVSGDLQPQRDRASFVLRYHDHQLPLTPTSMAAPLVRVAERCGSSRLTFIAHGLGALPSGAGRGPEAAARREIRHRDAVELRAILAELLADVPELGPAIDEELASIGADPDALHELLEQQHHRVAFWRTAAEHLDYRRFFDVTTLVGLRVEDPQVFAHSHELVMELVASGAVDGLRIDHPDGLLDPTSYLRRLAVASGGAWTVVEKILEPGEELPAWPVAGTTGYDFLHLVGGLFVDPDGLPGLEALHTRITGRSASIDDQVIEAKRFVLDRILGAELNRLVEIAVEVTTARREQRDHTRPELVAALTELLASFDVYRTYAVAEIGEISAGDAARIDAVADAALARRPDLDESLVRFLADVLALRVPDAGPHEAALVMRFQQLSGPAMAKAVEDTVFYRDLRLLAANEVGSSPAHPTTPVAEFHERNRATHERWPTTMLTLSTHDTKRAADVRARLAVLSEVAADWSDHVEACMPRLARCWPSDAGELDPHAAYLLLQTLVGAWPLTADRAVAYMEKAEREAKLATSWVDPDPAYEDALRRFVAAALGDERLPRQISSFVESITEAAEVNALAQTLLLLTCPGVPDLYQGTELWDLSLVDPDNRRPVDYGTRAQLLSFLAAGPPAAEVLARRAEGAPKLWVVQQALAVRRRHAGVFGPGAPGRYEPLRVSGADAERVVAFTRGGEVAVVVPRLSVRGVPDDAAVRLPPGCWASVFDEPSRVRDGGAPVAAGELLARFPVALLERVEEER